ncbi:MAG: UDP-N-acetylmuramate--L-alanine ligase, partial [Fidelibacterota bacterium]
TGKLGADAARKYGHSQVHYIKNKNEIGEFLIQIVRSNDMVITIGAGDVWKICNEIWEKLSAAVKKSHG